MSVLFNSIKKILFHACPVQQMSICFWGRLNLLIFLENDNFIWLLIIWFDDLSYICSFWTWQFGEVDIDGSLVAAKAIGAEDIVMLNNGCLCCTVRGDLVRMIGELVNKKKGKFDHIVIETTGILKLCKIFLHLPFFHCLIGC